MAETKRRTSLTESEATNRAVAIYARVSTEDQAERATIKSQLDFLRGFVDLHGLPVAGEYIDDGISGTVPFVDRPEGQRLLIDAEAGRFGAVLVYRIDRLGRSLRSLLDAHDALNGSRVAIRSATEPFDTPAPSAHFCSNSWLRSPNSRSRRSSSGRAWAATASRATDATRAGRFRSATT